MYFNKGFYEIVLLKHNGSCMLEFSLFFPFAEQEKHSGDPADLPMARRKSLQRFLEKRKER